MAHEFIQAAQALGPRLAETQRFAFEVWAREYRGDLGIALSDTYSLDAFLRDFDMYFCKLFDGARQDSGDPFAWGEAMIEHYENNRVDPKTRNLIFSDSLDIPKAAEIWHRFRDRTNVSFGIGTNLTHDTGVKPANIVIKMTECNGQPVVKLSDSPGKVISTDQHYLAWVRQAFDVPE
jgi:nicotinate phosphoribosyltransferase